MEFTHDCWGRNSYKQSLTSLQMLLNVRNDGLATVRSVPVVPREVRNILNQLPVLSSIPAQVTREKWNLDFQGPLPDLHRTLRRTAGLHNGSDYDISDFWSECAHATQQPLCSVFIVNGNGRAERRASIPPAFQGYVRPPASWYYLLYLCMFLTGDRALAATTLEEDDRSIQDLFFQSIELIEREIGVAPLIIWLPHYSSRLRRGNCKSVDFTEIHPAVLRPKWKDRVKMPGGGLPCYDAADHIVHSIATLPSTE
jgi:hypothetical protein